MEVWGQSQFTQGMKDPFEQPHPEQLQILNQKAKILMPNKGERAKCLLWSTHKSSTASTTQKPKTCSTDYLLSYIQCPVLNIYIACLKGCMQKRISHLCPAGPQTWSVPHSPPTQQLSSLSPLQPLCSRKEAWTLQSLDPKLFLVSKMRLDSSPTCQLAESGHAGCVNLPGQMEMGPAWPPAFSSKHWAQERPLQSSRGAVRESGEQLRGSGGGGEEERA